MKGQRDSESSKSLGTGCGTAKANGQDKESKENIGRTEESGGL